MQEGGKLNVIIRVYLKDDMSIEKVDGTNLLFIGVDKVKMEVYSPVEIDCDLVFERPDGYVYGPVTRSNILQKGTQYVNQFILDSTLFRYKGQIQCSIEISIDGQTRIAYCIFNNMVAVNKYRMATGSTEDIIIQVTAINLALDELKKDLDELKEAVVYKADNLTSDELENMLT